jgi:hypothetical protein
MAVFSTWIKGRLGGFGKKPKVPEYKAVDPAEEQRQAIAGNLANMPAAQELASKQNQFNVQQLQSMLATMVPGYHGIVDQQSKVVQSGLRGEMSDDVQAAVQNAAASRALAGGFGGSGSHRNLVARDFGRTSYDITQQAMDSASRWMATTAQMMPGQFDASSMFISPQQRIQYTFMNRENQFNRDWMKNQIKAAPDPYKAALGDAFIYDEKMFQDMVVGFFGGGGGTMGGGGGGGGGGGMGAMGAMGAMGGAGGGMGAAAMMCWVAREIYGPDCYKWRVFRHWLLTQAPKWFMRLYRRHGERFAGWIKNKPIIKSLIRRWMDTKLEKVYGTL